MNSSIHRCLGSVVFAAAVAGCSAQVDDPGAELGVSRSAATGDVGSSPPIGSPTGGWLSAFKRTEHKLTNYDEDLVSRDLGPIDGQTCWLSGIDGNLYYPDTRVTRIASFGVLTEYGRYTLWLDSVPESLVFTKAVCINRVAGRINGSWDAYVEGVGNASHIAASATNRQCFLSQVVLRNYSSTPGDGALIYEDDGGWWLTGYGGAQRATAVCIDLPKGFSATSGGSGTNPYLSWDEGYTAACGLTGILGPLTWGKFVSLSAPSNPPGRWLLRVSSGNLGGWACMSK